MMAYYFWRPGGVRRATSAGRLGRLRIFRCMARLEAMSRDDFCPGTVLDLEKMQRPLQNQKRTIVERRQGRLDGVTANKNEPSQQQLLWEGFRRRRSVV
jgi:hypothetical protein